MKPLGMDNALIHRRVAGAIVQAHAEHRDPTLDNITESILAALGLDDLDAAARRAQEAISSTDQIVARCRPNIGQVKVGLKAALTATPESEVPDA